MVEIDKISRHNIRHRFTKKVITNLLEFFILGEFTPGIQFCGYDIIKRVHLEFNFRIGPGTVYTSLHSMEHRGLIKGTNAGNRKRSYIVTKEGYEIYKIVTSEGFAILLIDRILRLIK